MAKLMILRRDPNGPDGLLSNAARLLGFQGTSDPELPPVSTIQSTYETAN